MKNLVIDSVKLFQKTIASTWELTKIDCAFVKASLLVITMPVANN